MTSRTAQRKSRAGKGASRRRPAVRGKGKSRRGTSSVNRSAIVVIGAALLVAAVIVGIGILRNPPGAPVTPDGDAAEAIRLVTNVPVSALEAVDLAGITPPLKLPDDVPALTQAGKPQIVYIGAEFCPFCAGQRWPLIVALSRFGRFTGLGVTTSSATDVFPNTPTFTFHESSYSSRYLVFTAVEEATNTGVPLETPTAQEQALLQTYDVPPYTTAAGAIPFLMIGDRYIQIGASYQLDALVGMTRLKIGQELADPRASSGAQSILGAANILTAAICQLTEGAPSTVCQSLAVIRAEQTLPQLPPG